MLITVHHKRILKAAVACSCAWRDPIAVGHYHGRAESSQQRQRSTTEAEMISLGSGLFSEAIPMQEFLEQVFDRKVELRCYQDNAAVIQIVEAGYSPKFKAHE